MTEKILIMHSLQRTHENLTLEVGVTFSIVVMRLDEAMKQFTVNVGTPIKESSKI